MMSLGDVAAKLGLPVFPCGANKRPVVETGFKAATSDPTEIAALFNRSGAELIGMPTGRASGLVAIDIDIRPDADGSVWLEENRYALPETRTHKTRSGGLHLLFRVPEGHEIRNSASRIAPGVDVRGEGGYVILPPSPGYAIADETEPAEMPRWLIRACQPPEPAPQPAPTPRQPTRHGGTPYGLAAIDAECHAITRAPFGRQEPTLNEAGLKIGALIAGGELEEGPAVAELLAAARFIASEPGREPWRPAEIEQKIRRAVADGKARPRQAPRSTVQFWDQDAPAVPDDPAYWDAVEAANDDGEPVVDAPDVPDVAQFPATPLRTRDLTAIPPRPWLYGRELVKGYVSVLGSPGGTGKTAWMIGVALSVVTGRSLLAKGDMPDVYRSVHKCGPVWLYNLEDPADEMDRRIAAALAHYQVTFEHVADAVYVDSGRDRPLIVAHRLSDGRLVRAPLVEALVAELKARGIVLLVVDPFVQSHSAEENRNEEMNLVMAAWGQVANDAQCAVWLVHHFRKGGQSGDAESFRGAAAIQGAARVMSTLATMTAEEASKMGVDDGERWRFIRRDNAKANMAPRASEAEWYELVSVPLNNGNAEYPDGDSVQVAAPWEPPTPFEGMPWAMIVRILDKIGAGTGDGEFYAKAKQAGDRWAGHVVMQVAQRQEGQAAIIIDAWLKSGVLTPDTYKSPSRKGAATACLRVDATAVAEMRRSILGADDDAG